MKYKKQIATGALAISLLVGGTNIFAATPQDLGIKNVQQIYQKQNKNLKAKNQGKTNTVGTISAFTNTGFTIEVTNIKTKVTSSIDITTNTLTVYSKNGIKATSADLAVEQKVIVSGNLDKTTNILTAKKVKIVTDPKPKN
jgi:archaellum component FlaF (FlaF/FlaG flagellin family)